VDKGGYFLPDKLWSDQFFGPSRQTVQLTARENTPEDTTHRWGQNYEQKRIQPQTMIIKPRQQFSINAGCESLNKFIKI
jgi:hypothetical protein